MEKTLYYKCKGGDKTCIQCFCYKNGGKCDKTFKKEYAIDPFEIADVRYTYDDELWGDTPDI